MITKLTVSNFRSLGEETVIRLGNLTALVGPNGSGKSSVADVIIFLRDCLKFGLETAVTIRGGIGSLRRWGYGRPWNLSIKVELKAGSETGWWAFEITGDSREEYRVRKEEASWGPVVGAVSFQVENERWLRGPADPGPVLGPVSLALPIIAGDVRFRKLAAELRAAAVYSIFPDKLRPPQRPDPSRPLEEHGENWCSVLQDAVKQQAHEEIATALGRVTGDIDALRVKRVGSFLSVQFRHGEVFQPSGKKRERWFNADQESDGTLRVAGILTAVHQHPQPSLIGVEEPELTVHPGALPVLWECLLEASQRTQILLTTHSPELLDLMEPEQVRLVEKTDGLSRVSRVDPEQVAMVRQRLVSLGELMRTEGIRPGELDGRDEGVE